MLNEILNKTLDIGKLRNLPKKQKLHANLDTI